MFGDMTENMGVKWREEERGWQLMEGTSQSFEYVHPFCIYKFWTQFAPCISNAINLSDLSISMFLTDVLMSGYVAQTYEDNGEYNWGVVDGGCYQVHVWGVGLHEV